MFIELATGTVTDVLPNDQTRFQCVLQITAPLDLLHRIEPGALVAAENLLSTTKEKRYTILQVVSAFPVPPETKTKRVKTAVTLRCSATPMGLELVEDAKKKTTEIGPADSFPEFGAAALLLDDETSMRVLHSIAPESRVDDNGTRIDVGRYATHADVTVGLDFSSLVRGNISIISARPRARTTITNNLITALLDNPAYPLHIVYCDVNNQGLLSLSNLIHTHDRARVLCLNDKFVPASVFTALKTPNDRQNHKRAVYDYLDMMILPSVLEPRRHDFTYAISSMLRANKLSIYRANELTIDQFINDIRIDILDGVEPEVEEYITKLMDGIAQTYHAERFSEKTTRDILDMIDEFSQDSKSHASRRSLYDLRAEVQSIAETYSKDIPSGARRTVQDIVNHLNDETTSSLLVVQGQKHTDILRFVGTLSQALVDERLKRLKMRVPVLFIFNNIDEYVQRNGGWRETGGERFTEILSTLIQNGRRHGLGFCVSVEHAGTLDRQLTRRIGSHFIGPITFQEEPAQIAQLLNVSEELLRPAVHYEDGHFLFMAADSPYHRRVPLPVTIKRNIDVLHSFLDDLVEEQERRRREYQAQEEERARRQAIEREERSKQEQAARERAEKEKAAHDKAAQAKSAPAKEAPASGGNVSVSDAPAEPVAAPAKARKDTRTRSRGKRAEAADAEPQAASAETAVEPVVAADPVAAAAPARSDASATPPQESLTFELRYGGYDFDEEDAGEKDEDTEGEGAEGDAAPAGDDAQARDAARDGARKRGSRGGRGRRRSSKKKPPQT
jgi:hypothetical protein